MGAQSEEENKSFKQKYKEMTRKEKLKKFGKLFIFGICILGLAYQTYELSVQFFGGQTIVSIKAVKFRSQRLPAITICYPIFASMEKLAKLYPEFNEEFENYHNIMDNVNETDFQNETIIESLAKISEIADNYTRMAYNSLSAYELFNKTSIPFKYRNISAEELNHKPLKKSVNIPIVAKVKGYKLTKTGRKLVEIQDYTPIESIASEYDEFWPRKCFTFFSQFKRKWDDLKIKIDTFNITINHDPNWYPPYHYNDDFAYFFSMHSPNTFPQMRYEDNYIELRAGYNYHMSFYRIRTKRLPPRYATNCRNYNLSTVSEEQSRADCIDRCVLKTMREKCGNCLHHIGSLFRRELVKKWSPEKLCDYERLDRTVCKKNDIYELRERCRDNCPTHCLRQFVEFNVKKESKIHSLSHWNPKTKIFVTHSRLPDQRIDHLPEMTFVSYIANFGGLAGMWLGLSALAIYDFIFTFV